MCHLLPYDVLEMRSTATKIQQKSSVHKGPVIPELQTIYFKAFTLPSQCGLPRSMHIGTPMNNHNTPTLTHGAMHKYSAYAATCMNAGSTKPMNTKR